MRFIAVALFVMFMGRIGGPPAMALAAMICIVAWLAMDEYRYAEAHRPSATVRPPIITSSPPAHWADSQRSAIRAAIPAEQPIQRTLIELTTEVAALEETIRRARQQHLRHELTDSFQQRQREVWRLSQQSIERVGAVTRGFEQLTPPAELIETLTRQNDKLARLTLAVRSARGVLASVIVTGIGDQRELDRATKSLTALSQALCEAMAIGLTDEATLCQTI